MRYVCLLVLSLSLDLRVALPAEVTNFRAELTCGHCSSYSNMVVDLTDSSRRQVGSSPVGQNGAVEFYGIREGVYTLTVRGMDGSLIHQDMVQVGPYAGPVSIVLPERPGPQRPASGTISVARLQHKVPRKAKKEYNQADDRMRDGDIHGSLEHLKKAVEIDPEYMEAYNNMGSRYMMLGDLPNAYASFKRALDLDSHSAIVQVNMGIALMTMGDHAAAEAAARRGVELDPSNLKAKYILGLCLYMQDKFTDETIHLLTRVREQFPTAAMALAYVHANTGHRDLARKSVEEYLRSGNKEHKEKAEELLARLK